MIGDFYPPEAEHTRLQWQTWPGVTMLCESQGLSSQTCENNANLILPKHLNVTSQSSCISCKHFHRTPVAIPSIPWTSIHGNPVRCPLGHGVHPSLIPLGHQRFTSTSASNSLGCFLGSPWVLASGYSGYPSIFLSTCLNLCVRSISALTTSRPKIP